MNIYKETSVRVRKGDKLSERFYTMKGVRQDCSLSPILFNVAFVNLEKQFGKYQAGGIVIGRKKSLAYVNDKVLMTSNATEIRETIMRLGKYLDTRGMKLNVGKQR